MLFGVTSQFRDSTKYLASHLVKWGIRGREVDSSNSRLPADPDHKLHIAQTKTLHLRSLNPKPGIPHLFTMVNLEP